MSWSFSGLVAIWALNLASIISLIFLMAHPIDLQKIFCAFRQVQWRYSVFATKLMKQFLKQQL
jgi:hypothetical protein